jgi:GNAT superfamily N-acetyltransferase
MMQIIPLEPLHFHDAAVLFTEQLQKFRQNVPVLPGGLEDSELVFAKLEAVCASGGGLAAVQNGVLLGYLTWFIVDNFRATHRKAAYCPEWGHACAGIFNPEVYQALYTAASARWSAQGCAVHALSFLTDAREEQDFWFQNGFGLLVVDGVRPMTPVDGNETEGVVIRKATEADTLLLADLEAEHWHYYIEAPIFMAARDPYNHQEIVDFISQPLNSYWLAEISNVTCGFMRFEVNNHGAATIVRSDKTIAITGAYLRPGNRGKGTGRALFNAALRDYQARGLECCSVDFESFNPEAARFWPKYFTPVCYSVMRCPENIGAASS